MAFGVDDARKKIFAGEIDLAVRKHGPIRTDGGPGDRSTKTGFPRPAATPAVHQTHASSLTDGGTIASVIRLFLR